MIAVTRSKCLSSSSASWSFIWPMPGIMPSTLAIGPIRRTAMQLVEEVLQRELLAARCSLAVICSFWSSSKACSACSMRVSTSPMPRIRLAIRSGWKTSKSSSFSPVDANRIGCAGDVPHRQRRTTAGVAVELGQHHAGDADAVAERLGGGDRVLADHRVDDEDDLVGVDRVADVGGLLHHLGVDAEPAGGVDDDDVAHRPPGVLDRVAGDLHRVADAVAGLGRVDLDAGPAAEHLELVDRVRALQVGRRPAAAGGPGP